MKQGLNEQTEQISLIEETVTYGGMLLSYHLLLRFGNAAERFRIRVSNREESCEVAVGGDLPFSMTCYESIVRGRVTPCTLADVMKDLQYLRWNL